MQTIILEFDELTQTNNIAHLEKALEAVPGVTDVDIFRGDQIAEVHCERADPASLLRVARSEGYRARVRNHGPAPSGTG